MHQSLPALGKTLTWRDRAFDIVYYGLLAALAVRFADIYAKFWAVGQGTNPIEIARGEAILPFQYRLLSPLIIDGLAGATGLSFEAAAALVTAACLFAALVCLDRLVKHATGSTVLARTAGVSAVFPLLTLFSWLEHSKLYYASDIPALLITALGLLLLLRQRYGWFALVFAIGTWNRETTYVLLAAAVLLEVERLREPRFLAFVGALTAYWAAVKVGLAVAYAGTPTIPVEGGVPLPGGVAIVTLSANLTHLLEAGEDLAFLPTLFGGALLPVVLFWRDLPASLQRLLLAGLLHLLAIVSFGLIFEFRVYVELLPFVWTALFAIGQARLQREAASGGARGWDD